jgi:hypothetical protein
MSFTLFSINEPDIYFQPNLLPINELNYDLLPDLRITIEKYSVCLRNTGNFKLINTNIGRKRCAIKNGIRNICSPKWYEAFIYLSSFTGIALIPYYAKFGFCRPGLDIGYFYVMLQKVDTH